MTGGKVRTADGAIDYTLKLPKTMGGTGEVGANPESLFAAG
jgi:osmotically inducible protein OsmC